MPTDGEHPRPKAPAGVRELIDGHPWTETMPRLLGYARRKISALVWSGVSRGPLPGGREANDLVHTAITKVLTGDRVWDPATQPDLALFVEDVIDSEISHLVESWEHRHVRPMAALPQSPDGRDNDPLDDVASGGPGPLEHALAAEESGRSGAFYESFRASLADDPVLQRIVECINDDVLKPGEIAARLGIPPMEVYNRRKQLQRRLMAHYEATYEAERLKRSRRRSRHETD